MIAKTGTETSWTGFSCSRASTTARSSVGFKSKDTLVDFNLSSLASLELTENQDFLRTPLNLSGRELGDLVAEAIAAVLSPAMFAEKSLELDLRTD